MARFGFSVEEVVFLEVNYQVEADTIEEARRKLEAGDYGDSDTKGEQTILMKVVSEEEL